VFNRISGTDPFSEGWYQALKVMMPGCLKGQSEKMKQMKNVSKNKKPPDRRGLFM
jgi:hypothetical protein